MIEFLIHIIVLTCKVFLLSNQPHLSKLHYLSDLILLIFCYVLQKATSLFDLWLSGKARIILLYYKKLELKKGLKRIFDYVVAYDFSIKCKKQHERIFIFDKKCLYIDLWKSFNCTYYEISPITVWPEPIWIKVKTWWQVLPQHQSTYLRGPESSSMEITPFKNCCFMK